MPGEQRTRPVESISTSQCWLWRRRKGAGQVEQPIPDQLRRSNGVEPPQPSNDCVVDKRKGLGGGTVLKVFISWSGDLSHAVALSLKDWLPSVIQSLVPYVSSEDIDKGARWSSDISKELEDSSYGILCVTSENVDAPWVNFEAGALSKSLERSRVAPFLFHLDRTEVRGPLLQFQSTVYEKEDVRKLVRSLNRACADGSVEEPRLDDIFEVWWPHLEQKLGALAARSTKPKLAQRTTQDLLSEILELARSQQKVLSEPERLLPPSYVEYLLSRASGRDVVPVAAFHDLERRWITLKRVVDMADPDTAVPEEVREAVVRLGPPLEFIVNETRAARRRRRLPPRDALSGSETAS